MPPQRKIERALDIWPPGRTFRVEAGNMANQKHTDAELDAALQEHEANIRLVAGLLQRKHGLSAIEARAEAEEVMSPDRIDEIIADEENM
jgi:hypothetical protein